MLEFLALVGAQLNYTRELVLITLIFARTMPMVVLTPFLGGKLAPAEVKMGLGLMFTILLYPLARDVVTSVPGTPWLFTLMLFKEIFIGLAIGFVNAHLYWAVEMGGRIIDTARMTSMSEVMEPHSAQRATEFGSLYYQLMVLIFMSVGGHHIFFRAFFYSFVTLPLDKGLMLGHAMEPFIEFFLHLGGEILMIAAVLATPIVAATFISDVVFGILNRVAPQLNAYFMSMPVKALGGVIIAFLVLDTFTSRLFDYVSWALVAVEKTLALLIAAT
jgi:flagellar biosynthesis protein FliR